LVYFDLQSPIQPIFKSNNIYLITFFNDCTKKDGSIFYMRNNFFLSSLKNLKSWLNVKRVCNSQVFMLKVGKKDNLLLCIHLSGIRLLKERIMHFEYGLKHVGRKKYSKEFWGKSC